MTNKQGIIYTPYIAVNLRPIDSGTPQSPSPRLVDLGVFGELTPQNWRTPHNQEIYIKPVKYMMMMMMMVVMTKVIMIGSMKRVSIIR